MKKKTITGNLFVKIAVFLLMVICVGMGAFYGYVAVYAWAESVYDESFDTYQENKFYWRARQDQNRIYDMLINGSEYESIDDYCRGKNISVEVYRKDGTLRWGNYKPDETGLAQTATEQIIIANDQGDVTVDSIEEIPVPGRYMAFEYANFPSVGGVETLWKDGSKIVVYVDSCYTYADDYYKIHTNAWNLYNMAGNAPYLTGGMLLLTVIFFIFLMCSAGHHNDSEDIRPGILHGIWLDVLAVLFAAVMGALTVFMVELFRYVNIGGDDPGVWYASAVISAWAMLIAFLGTFFSMEFAIRIKLGGALKYSLIGTLLRLCVKGLKLIRQGIAAVLGMLPAMGLSFGCFATLCLMEYSVFYYGFAHMAGIRRVIIRVFILWLLEKIILFVLVCYFGIVRGKLWKAGAELAEGNLAYHVDTSKMILGYKKHGDHLNNISEGMAKAVTERMRSEHLKTELITNVSHDLKTPLTSIINYSDLLQNQFSDGTAEADPEKTKEYAGVIHRQSIRLKKLLEDLLEVSKASTGNLTTEFAPCDIKVLITQITGEYEQRFEEKKLELLCTEPAENICILADQRHMFRIFDNLLGNIYKYAQPGSRVYLSVEKEEQRVKIIFRNMSEYPLNTSGEDLMERFVRGDSSRHKEGNGLGLSIAMSLTQLQKGTMQIVTDGDLFKAVLDFPINQ